MALKELIGYEYGLGCISSDTILFIHCINPEKYIGLSPEDFEGTVEEYFKQKRQYDFGDSKIDLIYVDTDGALVIEVI